MTTIPSVNGSPAVSPNSVVNGSPLSANVANVANVANMNEGEAKSKNADKNEAKRLAKLAKFQAKKPVPLPSSKKEKVEKKPKAVEETHVNTTPSGQKKILGPFASTYTPKAVEESWYEWWETSDFFKPELNPDGSALSKGTFVIPIPPPNITGSLHLGHALTNSIQDCLIRWNRMRGMTVLWVPGVDHAGIATQVVVEKRLAKELKVTRHQLGREKFIQEVFKWKETYGDRIYTQLKKLGSSFDWSRARFTMDPSLCEAVNEAFVRMHEDGSIYRANRLVNWCTKLKTALSNLEVENKELEGSTYLSVPDHDPSKTYEFGVLISFAYPIQDSNEKIVVATTRLETMLGDSAIAVHPNDKRYAHLIGKNVVHPFQDRVIPIIADDYVDPEFGSGAVKITPAHDFNDFQMGQRHKLDFTNIFTDEGQINENGAPFTGLQRFDARLAVLEGLKAKGLYVKTSDNKMVLPICGRSGNIVEPMMKPQWWINGQLLAPAALEAVKSGEIKIIPSASEKEWFRWLENIQDWCISRQLWWGHRVPAYFVDVLGDANDRDDASRWVSARNEAEAMVKAKAMFPKLDAKSITIHQDEDVLDTWFSSGLWPFSIMGWPNQTKDMDLFFPNSLLETGCDILFFWVARMVMMSLHLTKKVPFKTVYCHAMVRDAHGRKMSKSLGNVIDPMDVIYGITLSELQARLDGGNLDASEVEKAKAGQALDYPNGIPECGTDALRFTLLAYTSSGRDLNLDIMRVEGYKKFCNKLWNATRFALLKLGDDFQPLSNAELTGHESLAELWIFSKLNKTIIETNSHLESFNFMAATSAIYQFWLYDLCDVYLEVTKPIFSGEDEDAKRSVMNTLYTMLDQGLKLLHPFMPFVTEELYQRLPRRVGDKVLSIMKSEFPEPRTAWGNSAAESDYELVFATVKASRSLLVQYNLKSDAKIYLQVSNQSLFDLMVRESTVSKTLIKGCSEIHVLHSTDETPKGCALYTISADVSVYLYIRDAINVPEEMNKIAGKVTSVQGRLGDLLKRTETESYLSQVRDDIKALDCKRRDELEAELVVLAKALDDLKGLSLD